MSKILIHTLGSSGDFNPLLSLSLELRARGHDVHFALNPTFAAQARSLGFTATEAGPDWDPESPLLKRLLAPAGDGLHLVKLLFGEVLIPAIRPAAEALVPLARDADLFISHTIQLAAPVVARETGVPWVSVSPAALVYPTSLYPPPGVAWKQPPAWFNALGWRVGQSFVRQFDALASAEYQSFNMPPLRDIVVGGAYSRLLTLGLWSPSYFPRPTDWPEWLQVGGYARWDAPFAPAHKPDPALYDDAALPAHLPHGDASASGLSCGPLIVFTLGSSVASDPRGFYEMAVAALAPTPWRGLLVGALPDMPIPVGLRGRIQTVPYARYSDIFPMADVIVHSGGIGTTQACCYYGKPAIIVPRAADQFENAAHVQREGWGLRLQSQHLSASLMRRRIERVLCSPDILRRVSLLGERMRAEDGPARSADLLEGVLTRKEALLPQFWGAG